MEERLRRIASILNRELEVFELGSKIQSQVRVRDGEGPARVLPAPAAEGDPGGARRGGRAAGGGERAALAARRARAARGDRPGRAPRAVAAREAAAGRRGARGDPHLPRLDPLAAVGHGHRGQPRPRARPRDPRRGPLRPREGQGADHRVPRGLEAEERPLRADPLLRGPARGRQDLARPVDRPGARPQVRAHLGRRRARRGRDPGAPADVHRRDARERSSARSGTPGR